MTTTVIPLPVNLPPKKERPTAENIPPTKVERDLILQAVRTFLDGKNVVPPIPLDDLRTLTQEVLRTTGIEERYRDFTAIVVNNELWRETMASIPYSRRLLLLPKCMREENRCPATFDEFGLLCKMCGLCSLQDLQVEAERLGYAVLIAEGSPIVMSLIRSGKIEAIIGVSCINVLEKAFPAMEQAAIPGMAVPLHQDDCGEATVDLDWVWEMIHATSEDRTRRLNLSRIHEEVESWFEPNRLWELVGEPNSETEKIGYEWLSRGGKRWRPFLTVALYRALQDRPEEDVPNDLKRVAIAVECFHKASLIHDDIEDEDPLRYGQSTLHEELGVPVALNAGDFLVGEGYRLVGECEVSAEKRARMLSVAAEGHRSLSLGQGAELLWTRNPRPLRSVETLAIFRQKTAPAFEVSLRLSAVYAGREDDLDELITRYSESLGLAYQIRDDLEDLPPHTESWNPTVLRPNIPLAIAYEKARGEGRAFLERVWKSVDPTEIDGDAVYRLMEETGAVRRAADLLEAYKESAVRSLTELENANVKGLLRRIIGEIFNQVEIEGWCGEFEARNAASRAVGDEAAR